MRVLLLKTPDGRRSAACTRSLLVLWRCPAGSYEVKEHRQDPVRTAWAMSGSYAARGGFTVLGVEVSDPQVACVESGPESERLRRPVEGLRWRPVR